MGGKRISIIYVWLLELLVACIYILSGCNSTHFATAKAQFSSLLNCKDKTLIQFYYTMQQDTHMDTVRNVVKVFGWIHKCACDFSTHGTFFNWSKDCCVCVCVCVCMCRTEVCLWPDTSVPGFLLPWSDPEEILPRSLPPVCLKGWKRDRDRNITDKGLSILTLYLLFRCSFWLIPICRHVVCSIHTHEGRHFRFQGSATNHSIMKWLCSNRLAI